MAERVSKVGLQGWAAQQTRGVFEDSHQALHERLRCLLQQQPSKKEWGLSALR
jgi:hypothetical protein